MATFERPATSLTQAARRYHSDMEGSWDNPLASVIRNSRKSRSSLGQKCQFYSDQQLWPPCPFPGTCGHPKRPVTCPANVSSQPGMGQIGSRNLTQSSYGVPKDLGKYYDTKNMINQYERELESFNTNKNWMKQYERELENYNMNPMNYYNNCYQAGDAQKQTCRATPSKMSRAEFYTYRAIPDNTRNSILFACPGYEPLPEFNLEKPTLEHKHPWNKYNKELPDWVAYEEKLSQEKAHMNAALSTLHVRKSSVDSDSETRSLVNINLKKKHSVSPDRQGQNQTPFSRYHGECREMPDTTYFQHPKTLLEKNHERQSKRRTWRPYKKHAAAYPAPYEKNGYICRNSYSSSMTGGTHSGTTHDYSGTTHDYSDTNNRDYSETMQ